MKILYAIQTQGNGHLSRAQKLVPEFIKKARVDILTSGPSNNFPTYKTPIKPVSYTHLQLPTIYSV